MTTNRQLYDNAQFGSLRQKLRHEWRQAADTWLDLDHKARELENRRKALLAQMKMNLIAEADISGEKLALGRAESIAIASEEYQEFATECLEAKTKANSARIERDDRWAMFENIRSAAADARKERHSG
jgi:hypothetical protein